jgi:hypothetical protein
MEAGIVLLYMSAAFVLGYLVGKLSSNSSSRKKGGEE